MKNLLRIGALQAPKNRLKIVTCADTGKVVRIAGLSAAGAVVIGVAAGSAFFVDYLAERARGGEIAVAAEPVAVRPAVVPSSSPSQASASAATTRDAPVTTPSQPQAVPIEARLPDPEAIARVAVASSRTTDGSVLAYADDEPGDSPFAAEDGTTTGAIFPDEGAPVSRPRAAVGEPVEPEEEENRVASLPGVEASATGAVTGTAKIRSAVNMRSAGRKGASVLGVVPAGTSVNVMSCDMWCQISWDGKTGWVYKSFLTEVVKQDAAEQAAPARPEEPAAKPVRRSLSTRG